MIYSKKIEFTSPCNMLRRSVLSGLVVLLSWFMVGCSVFDDPLPSYSDTSIVNVGDRAPHFVVESIEGELLSVAGESDPATLLVLFSHTCPDCKALLDAIQKRINDGVVPPRIVAVARGGEEVEIREFVQQNGYTFPIAANPDAEIYYQYATMYVPRCYVIDNEGYVQYISFEDSANNIDTLFSHTALL